jgi:hypothetical protein
MPAVEKSAERDWTEHEMLVNHGTDNQQERWEAGLLPEPELLQLARYVLFLPFASFRRWVKLEAGDMRHGKDCTGGATTFATRFPGSLTHDEWSNFRKITEAVDAANEGPIGVHGVVAVIVLVEHVGICSICPAQIYGRAASIRIEWAGRPLSREYSLEEP